MALILNNDDEFYELVPLAAGQSPRKKFRARTKTDPARSSSESGGGPGGSNKPPRKTKNQIVQIVRASIEGYEVRVANTNILAYLRTEETFEIGSKLKACFCTWTRGGRAVLLPGSEFLSGAKYNPPPDLLPPCTILGNYVPVVLSRQVLPKYFSWIESYKYSGIFKFTSEFLPAQGALIIYRGKCLGGFFHRHHWSEKSQTVNGLKILLDYMDIPDAARITYSLPDELILSISASFIGYNVFCPSDTPAEEFFQYLCVWFQKESATGNAVLRSDKGEAVVVYFHQGEVIGTFNLSDQKYSSDQQFALSLMSKNENVAIAASILPWQIKTEAESFGFDLSSAYSDREPLARS